METHRRGKLTVISEERKYARLAYPRHDQRLLRSSLLAQAGKWKDKNDMKIWSDKECQEERKWGKHEENRESREISLVICTSFQSAVRKSCYRVGPHSVVMIMSSLSTSSLSSSVYRGVVLSASSRLEKVVVSSALLTILLLMFSSPVASLTCWKQWTLHYYGAPRSYCDNITGLTRQPTISTEVVREVSTLKLKISHSVCWCRSATVQTSYNWL